MDQVPLCPVDALILSALSYVHFEDLIPQGGGASISIGQAAQAYLDAPAAKRGRCRCEDDLKLLRALMEAPRFSALPLSHYEDQFIPEEETQFGALAISLPDGSAFLAFRGTDATLVGWKEDFNMSFMDTVPAQRAAADYAQRFAASFSGPLRLGGHSKGGNLSIFAAASLRPFGTGFWRYIALTVRALPPICSPSPATRSCSPGFLPLCPSPRWWVCFWSERSPTPWCEAPGWAFSSTTPTPGRCWGAALWK